MEEKMKAQYYNDYDETIRIFCKDEYQGFMDCLMYENSIKEAERALSRCHLRRKGKWQKRKWGYEARVSWK
jgi:hypothetical protein